MPGYANFMKDLVTKEKLVTFDDDDTMQHCSAIAIRSLVQKKEDPGAFTIPCTGGSLHCAKALCDFGASINLMPLSIYKKLDFVILDCEFDFKVPIILGRPFLATGRALVDMEKGQMKFRLNNEEATFNICRSMRQSGEIQTVVLVSGQAQVQMDWPLLDYPTIPSWSG
ncbi:uncharacterized protein [Solanum lycopersicum]|uniref:uncharacterized protein n=1 Tax=Solanum lycopersicum TaxID=4081 RepID=UPI003747CF8D